jgi:hypothetical protein
VGGTRVQTAEEQIEIMETSIVVVAIIAYFAFRQWIQHHRRILVHRERIAAIEKGVELPSVDLEVKRSSFNVQRMLLLSGLIWVALGVATFLSLSVILSFPVTDSTKDIPKGLQLVGLAPIGIGLAHLITYWVGAKRER